MTINEVPVLREGARGCGYRKKKGIYLVTSATVMRPCGKLPVELDICPCCGGGIKVSRGWTWIDGDKIVTSKPCKEEEGDCDLCPMDGTIGRSGLLWVGEKFYARPEDWMKEAKARGVSRRISSVPRDFEIGKTWVFVAHRKAIDKGACPECSAAGKIDEDCLACGGDGRLWGKAIFHAFMPTAVQYVCTGTETEEELAAIVKRGLTPVRVEKVKEGALPGLDAVADDDE